MWVSSVPSPSDPKTSCLFIFLLLFETSSCSQPGLAWTDPPPASGVGLPVPPHPAQRLTVSNGYLTHELEVPYPNPSWDLDTGQALGRQQLLLQVDIRAPAFHSFGKVHLEGESGQRAGVSFSSHSFQSSRPQL